MPSTFSPGLDPSTDSTLTYNFKTLTAGFGDGYSQTAPDGLNDTQKQLDIVWHSLTASQLSYIEGFLQTVKGSTPFYYTFPGDSATLYKMKDNYKKSFPTGAGATDVTVTFLQAFDLV